VTIVFRTKGWLTLPQLVDAWGSELAKVGEEPNRSQNALQHVLLEDIINGRLDHTGPLQDGRKLGLHLEFGGRAYFAEGHEIRTLMADPSFSLHRILIMKEAVLDFAKRREIPPPSWWTDGTSVSTDAGVTTRGTHSIAASPIPALTHSARPRGRRSKKLDQVKEAMREDIRLGQKTPDGLRDMLEKELAAGYGVSRDTARRARDAVLSEMQTGAAGRREGRTGRA
jgi:Bacterial regulatory proteins, gntR family